MLLNKDEFVQCAIEAGLIVNEDYLKYSEYVDSLLIDLGKFAVDHCEYLGKGIGRVAYRFRDWVIKINRDVVNISDRYDDYEGCRKSYNYLDSAETLEVPEEVNERSSEGMRQMICEMKWYLEAPLCALDHVAQIYACSDNYAVQIVEYCDEVNEDELYDEYDDKIDDYEYLCENFSDTHSGNLGYNRNGKLVMIDLGWEA